MTNNRDNELDAFRDAEHGGWEQLAQGYAHYFESLVEQAIGPLLDAARINPGYHVLDVCCGPGYVSAQASARGATTTGIDFSDSMIKLARRRFPKLSFRTGDAEQLNFRDEGFDAVVMNFGLHHLARPERALAEAARVLRPGGRLACTVWALPGENVGHQIMLAAIEAHGRQDLRLPTGPPMFRFTDFEVCREALQRAGFVEPSARTIYLTWDLPAPYGVYDAFQAGGVRPAMTLEAQTPEALEKIREAVRKASKSFRVGSRLMIPMAAVLVSGMRPENRDLATGSQHQEI